MMEVKLFTLPLTVTADNRSSCVFIAEMVDMMYVCFYVCMWFRYDHGTTQTICVLTNQMTTFRTVIPDGASDLGLRDQSSRRC